MTIGDQIRDGKLKYDINRDAAKIYHPCRQSNLLRWISYRWGNITI